MPTPGNYQNGKDLEERAIRRQEFGSRIKALRQAAGLTQEALALRAGLDRPFLVQIESGKRSLLVERLDDLAAGLGVTCRDLFSPDLDGGAEPPPAAAR